MRSLLSLAPFVFSTELASGDGAVVAMKRATKYSCREKKNNAKLFLLLSYSDETLIFIKRCGLKATLNFLHFSCTTLANFQSPYPLYESECSVHNFLPKDVLNNLHVNEKCFTYEQMELIKTQFQR